MLTQRYKFAPVLAVVAGFAAPMALAENRIDTQLPNAPELAAYGEMKVGVRQIELVHGGQVDILSIDPAAAKPETLPTYDRPLTVEVWYPAADGATGDTAFRAFLRDATTEVTLNGQAMRDAEPAAGTAYPLVIVSHGYPGNRFLMSHLAENIASKGYVVASIDHTDSTYRTQAAFGSTRVNRSLDQLFVLDEMARLSQDESSFLNGLVDADNTGLIGYSMGGYGALVFGGAGLAATALDHPRAGDSGALAQHLAGSDSHAALRDPRLKAIMPIGPWGNAQGMWDAAGIAQMDTPMLMMAGTSDDVSNYAAMRGLFEGAASDRYLLSFQNAGHNAAAPIPAPSESWAMSDVLGWAPFDHYADAVWDTLRMNNIAQHFAAAFMGMHLRGEALAPFLDGNWQGFAQGTALGLTLEHLPAR